jgi:beta-1,4-mannosyl-glycoprotein beta-1,4-N-acetylglucosaminyltransferase
MFLRVMQSLTPTMKSIAEFSLKMSGYSHADRVGGDDSLLQPEVIQNKICKGEE